MLSPVLLERLRTWWRVAHAQGKMLDGGWLFPGQNLIDPMSTRQLNRAVHAAAANAGSPAGRASSCRSASSRGASATASLRHWRARTRPARPAAVLAYLSRYTHRVAIAKSRLVALEQGQVTFRWKDYRAKGRTRHKTMTLSAGEFMRRFLLHVLPSGFHRIRHYGLLANAGRREHLARARELLLGSAAAVPAVVGTADPSDPAALQPVAPTYVCPDCGAPMEILGTLVRAPPIRAPPAPAAA